MAPRASLPFRFFVDLVLDSPKDQTIVRPWSERVGHHDEADIAYDGSVYTFMERAIDEPACSAAREAALAAGRSWMPENVEKYRTREILLVSDSDPEGFLAQVRELAQARRIWSSADLAYRSS